MISVSVNISANSDAADDSDCGMATPFIFYPIAALK